MATGISTYGQVFAQINTIKRQQLDINTLSTQLSTGKITQKFTGLDTNVLSSKRARADLQALDTYNSNITNSKRRLSLMQDSIQGFKNHAREFLDMISNLSRESTHQGGDIIFYDDPATPEVENIQLGHTSADTDIDLQSMIDFADNIYDSFLDLLNIEDGGRYLLSGAESGVKPINDTGTLDAAVNTLITDWKDGNITTDDLIADLSDRTTETNPNAITDSTVGYSTKLSNGDVGDVFVRASETLEVKYTSLATESAFRDVLVAVSYVKSESLSPIADAYIPPNPGTPGSVPDVKGAPGATLDEQKENFFAVLNSLQGMVNKAVDDMDLELFKLAGVEARLNKLQINQQQEKSILESMVADIENTDQNEVALKLNATLTQIESSYAISSRLQQLSLVNFI